MSTDTPKPEIAGTIFADSEWPALLVRALAENTPDHIIVQDRELRYRVVINPQLGLKVEDMIGKTDADFSFVDPATLERLTTSKRTVLATQKPFHFFSSIPNFKGELEYFDGTYVPLVDRDGQIQGLIGYFRNITQIKRSEDALREKNAALEAALAHVKTLRGLVPICSACKKVRNDRHYWQQVESYLAENSGMEFTHTLCPESLPRYFGQAQDRPVPDASS